MVISMKGNFSSFHKFVSNNYKSNGSKKLFTSDKTFSKCFFSWASHQPREFRKSCSWCTPKVLACDGTKIGILHQNMNIQPIEETEATSEKNPIVTATRRFDRCFLSNPAKLKDETTAQHKERVENVKMARRYLKDLTSNVSSALTQLESESQKRNLLDVFPVKAKELLTKFLTQKMTTDQLSGTKRLFYILSFDAPFRSFLPTDLIPSIKKIVESRIDEAAFSFIMTECSEYNFVFGQFLSHFFDENGFDSCIISLIDHLLESLTFVAESVSESPVPNEILKSYNPPKTGRFYYFNRSGNQLRSNRYFTIDAEQTKKQTDDDQPITSSCSKQYPNVAKRGASFLFLWFCPSHGHCYGGHIVNGSEGRKDPVASLYQYMKVAPEVVFYDFACSLEEYCMNREASFFKHTRFYHDIFHGYAHNCSSMYPSKGLRGMQFNTSICEQFNSFLQCVKASAKHMSQSHFIFYVQSFIDIWNEKKKANLQKKLKIQL